MNWVKKHTISIVVGLLLNCLSFVTFCQKVATDSLLVKAFANDQLLPILITCSQKSSPEIKRLTSSVNFATANQKISRNAIFERLSLLASYHYGTNYSAINQTNSIDRFSTVQTGFYNLGVGLQLPLSQVLNRKYVEKTTQAQVEMANYEKENTSLYIKMRVIEYYQELKLSHRLLLISNSNKQAAQVNYNMVERDYLQGQVTTEQISRVLDVFNKSKIEYETYLNKFQTNLMELDAYTGVSFSALLNTVK